MCLILLQFAGIFNDVHVDLMYSQSYGLSLWRVSFETYFSLKLSPLKHLYPHHNSPPRRFPPLFKFVFVVLREWWGDPDFSISLLRPNSLDPSSTSTLPPEQISRVDRSRYKYRIPKSRRRENCKI